MSKNNNNFSILKELYKVIFYIETCKMFTTSYRLFLEHFHTLTLNLPNFLNGVIHLTFLALSIIILRDIKMKT